MPDLTPAHLFEVFNEIGIIDQPARARLEARLPGGLIEMRPNPEDGRSKTVWITDAGRALRAEVIADLAPGRAMLMDEFGTDRLLAAKPVLTDLRKFLDENHERG